MARRTHLLAPSAIAFAIFGCGGASDPDLFGASGVSGATSAGAPSVHGAGAPASGGDTSDAGSVGLSGSDTGGESAGGSSAGGSNGGVSGDGEAGHSGGGSVVQAGSGGSAGHAEGGSAGHVHGGAGTGGTGTAGSAGSSAGAGGGHAEPTCSELLAQAAAELTTARACIFAGNAEQCTGVVETMCGCQVPVEKNDSVLTKAYESTLKRLNAKHCSQVCPAIACLPVTRAECRANVGTTKGSCVASYGVSARAF